MGVAEVGEGGWRGGWCEEGRWDGVRRSGLMYTLRYYLLRLRKVSKLFYLTARSWLLFSTNNTDAINFKSYNRPMYLAR